VGDPWWSVSRKFMDKMFFPPRQATTRREVASGAVRAAQDRDSALLDHGFGEKDVIVADPRKLDRVVGPETKVIGLLTVHDLMGYYSTVSQLLASIFRLINWKPTPSHTQIYHLAN
jgi:hypothetical protein